jgi:DeoR/GlpR family transcriptional regulator of sugar metabolism
VANTEIADQFDVSAETIRRDIIMLDGQGLLRRTHGGALSLSALEPAFDERMAANIDGKRAIGRLAASLVPDKASVIIDFGTTAFCVAEALAGHAGLTVVTAGLQAANFLAGRNGNEVYLIGGQLQASEGATLGRDSTRMLERYFADFAFVGAGAVSPHPWLMDFSREAAELRALMLRQARHAVVLADHTKFNRLAPHRVDNFERTAYLITDRKPDVKTARSFRGFQGRIMVAAPAPARRRGGKSTAA